MPINHDDSDRGQVLPEVAPVRHRADNFDATHMFQKPEDLSEFLIRKLSNVGDLVVDLFGCSGSFCIAAERLGRRWVYAESNPTVYAWGSERVHRAAREAQHKAS